LRNEKDAEKELILENDSEEVISYEEYAATAGCSHHVSGSNVHD
jgi:hypothetical protein